MVYIKYATSNNLNWRFDDDIPPMILGKTSIEDMTVEVLPCWSLAALLKTLNFPSLTQNKEDKWEVCIFDHNYDNYIEKTASNPVDACVEMILKLHELNLL